jgi:AraC family transcriptional regulator
MPLLRVPTSTGTCTALTQNVPGASVTLACFPPSLRLLSHVHERACLTVLLDGVMAEQVRGRERYCERASILVKPALERHEDVFGRHGSRQIIIEPSTTDEGPLAPFLSFFSTERFLKDGRAEQLARRLANELEHRDAFSPLAIPALTYELIVLLARSVGRKTPTDQPPPPWLRRVCEFLQDARVGVPRLSDLAREAGVHPAHLSRAFRAHYGCSIGAFVRRQRIEAAAQALGTTDATIAGIAATNGFTDQSHFTRQFLRHFGLTPSEYRKRVQST